MNQKQITYCQIALAVLGLFLLFSAFCLYLIDFKSTFRLTLVGSHSYSQPLYEPPNYLMLIIPYLAATGFILFFIAIYWKAWTAAHRVLGFISTTLVVVVVILKIYVPYQHALNNDSAHNHNVQCQQYLGSEEFDVHNCSRSCIGDSNTHSALPANCL